jgi:hypothetical protein
MKRQLGMKLVLGFLASSPLSGFGQQTGTGRGVPITMVVDDRANVKLESLAVAKQVVIRVMSAAGFAITWIDTQDALTTDGLHTDSSEQLKLSRSCHLSVVIAPEAYRGLGLNEAGFAAVTTGSYRRAYVFLDRAKVFSEEVTSLHGEKTVGTVLGLVICHELGHLLMPGKPHAPSGIMRAAWGSKEWDEAAEGLLLFSRRQAEIMRSQAQDHCSASLARKGRQC